MAVNINMKELSDSLKKARKGDSTVLRNLFLFIKEYCRITAERENFPLDDSYIEICGKTYRDIINSLPKNPVTISIMARRISEKYIKETREYNGNF